ncbi:cytochrome P450 [Hypoxylon rubiginosum]|uniref:Cytochrome P450 n=1 Tax=Hypoxylon rubiginosum TaxID=110542 RepID=A0ACB9Z2F0_9PEZI|nr:cytochrome P450 [Hypoxylon rubiginosum]
MAYADFIPESWPFSAGTTAVVIILATYFIAYQLSSRKVDPREPTVIVPIIPVVGHILGMASLGGRYIKNLGLRNRNLPIFTLPVPASRIYIVADPSLAAAVQRASKVLSFTPIIPEVTERVLGLDKATMEITRKNLDPGPGEERGFLADIQDMVYAWLGPGDYLGELSLEAAREMRDEIAAYAASSSATSKQPTDLLNWVRHLVTVSTAKYLYGPQNPIALDPKLEGAFWDFDHGLGSLLMNILPSITASRAYAGRERLSAALQAYLEKGLHRTGSKIVQRRVDIATAHGWALPGVAREELSFLFAGIVNATTSTFWLLTQIYADPELLAAVRGEVESILEREGPSDSSSSGGGGGGGRTRLRIADLKDRCPVLAAAYRECLRLGSDTYSTRLVKEDTLLANRYFLKKNAVVQIAGGVIHADRSIWGDDVDTFNYRRFLDRREGGGGSGAGGAKQQGAAPIHPAAFRAFGGGKTLCPGRHFAMHEILAFVALVVLQFDVQPARGGRIEVPRKNDGVLPVHILEPVSPVQVLISKRADGFARDGLDVEFVM